MKIRHLIIGYVLLFLFCCIAVYLSGVQVLALIGWYFLLYLLISYGLYFIWKKIHGRDPINLLQFFVLFLYRVFSSIAICGVLISLFCYYQNDINPAKLPYYLMSNGEKTLRFQTMSHIASPEFYEDVRNNILRSKKTDYVLFYEGVRPGSEENTLKFNDALGIDLTPNLYSKLSILYGITAQNNAFFLGVENNKDYNVDLDIDTIMNIYDIKKSSDSQDNSRILGQDMENTEELISRSIEGLSKRELSVVRYLNQGLMNMIIKNETMRNFILKSIGKEDIFSVILHDRNKHIVNEILLSDEEKIFIIYGMMHFEGVYELLKNSDPNWEIISTTQYQVIR